VVCDNSVTHISSRTTRLLFNIFDLSVRASFLPSMKYTHVLQVHNVFYHHISGDRCRYYHLWIISAFLEYRYICLIFFIFVAFILFFFDLQTPKNKRCPGVFDRAHLAEEWLYKDERRVYQRRIAMQTEAERSEAFVATGRC